MEESDGVEVPVTNSCFKLQKAFTHEFDRQPVQIYSQEAILQMKRAMRKAEKAGLGFMVLANAPVQPGSAS